MITSLKKMAMDVNNRFILGIYKSAQYDDIIRKTNAFVHNSWLTGNAPMFTGFNDRLEILSRGALPPDQTLEGFYEGESIPVNEALSKIFIMLHITEHTGRGVPRITRTYGRETIKIKESSILVTIPFNRLGDEVYAQKLGHDVQVDAQVELDKVLAFCSAPKSLMEIAEFLGYKDRRTVRKFLNPLIDTGRLAMTDPDKPTSSKQKYITIK